MLMGSHIPVSYVKAQAAPAQSKIPMKFTLTTLIRQACTYSTPLPLPRICLSLAPTYAMHLLKLSHPNRAFTSTPCTPLMNSGRITMETLPFHQVMQLLCCQQCKATPRHKDSGKNMPITSFENLNSTPQLMNHACILVPVMVNE
jgi:hypothetical protein